MNMRRLRLRFWLLALDVIRACGGRMGSAAYVYALCKASNATDWGEP
jgi:hypothetical protein